MASRRFNPQGFLAGLLKFILGVAIAITVLSLAGAATARYFLTQLSSLPERPVYKNDAPAAPAQASSEANAVTPPDATSEVSVQETEAKALYQVAVTYGSGLLVRSGPGADYGTIGGVDYDDTVDVLEESGRWLKIQLDSDVEGWIKGQGNTKRL